MLTRKTFTTKDTRGCSFEAKCYIYRNYTGGPIIESTYDGVGETAKTLKDLQEKVGNK